MSTVKDSKRTAKGAAQSSITVSGGKITIEILCPGTTDQTDAGQDDAGQGSSRAERFAFAANANVYVGVVLWHRYATAHGLLAETIAAEAGAAAAGVEGADDEAGASSFTRTYDPMAQVAASYATVSGVRQYTAEHFLDLAVACMERIPAIGLLLRDGLITPAWFRRTVVQTALIDDPDVLAFIDAEIAHRLRQLGGLTAGRVENEVAAVVAEHDPDALVLTREQAKASKQVIVNPVADGMAEVIVTTTAEDATLCRDALDAVIEGVCPNDGRTRGQLRSDAAVSLLTGVPFVCACEREDCTATLSTEQVAARCARVVLHVVVRKESLDGTSNTPATLDGYGPISAAHARDLAARPDAVRRDLNIDELVDHMAQPGNGYRPSAALDAAMRGVFGSCTWPGCSRPAWGCDLDHATEYDHVDPAAGGPTCACNLNPKCRFHHGLKTHTAGWIDDQITDANGVIWTEVTTPDGITIRQQAANQWLLPELGLIPCGHGAPTRPEVGDAGPGPERTRTRLQGKHRYRLRRRAENRRARENMEAAEAAARAAREAADGEPPF